MITRKQIAVAALAALALAATALGHDWRTWPVNEGGNGHWYALTAPNTWAGCRDEAIAVGGHLVTINDAAENTWLHQQFGTPGIVGQSLWIGFNDRAAEGRWEWVGGDGGWWERGNPASTSYVNWYPFPGAPEPNGGVQENAAVINYAGYNGDDRHGGWTDASEGWAVPGIIEALAARADLPVQVVGQWGGSIGGAAVEGDRAYVGVGPRLVVLDVSQPSAPTVLGQSPVLPGFVSHVAISGYAYVMAGGLQVIDISNPAAPVRVGGCDTGGDASAVAISGSYMYVAGYHSLQVIDVSDPAAPVRVGGCNTSGFAGAVALSGGYAYVAWRRESWWYVPGGLDVIDIANPAAPVRVSGYNTSAGALSVAISGGYAYVANWYEGFQVLDISNPAAPVRIGGCDTCKYALSVAVSGGYAYVTHSWLAGLDVIDISNPAAPVRVGECDTSGAVAAISGGYAYLIGGSLQVIDISNPAVPVRVGGYEPRDSVGAVAVSGGYAYVTESSGLEVIDISNPAAPVRVGGCSIGGWANDLCVSGGYAYVTFENGSGGLDVIDVSHPAAPVRVGRYMVEGPWATGLQSVAVSAGYAYVGEYGYGDYGEPYTGRLEVIDISNPAAPVLIGFYYNDWLFPRGLAVSGGYAYVSWGSWIFWSGFEGWSSFDVIDISDPAAPVRVGGYEGPEGAGGMSSGVALSGAYAYADGSAGLHVIDISEPTAPVPVGVCNTVHVLDLAILGHYACVVDSDLHVIDISTPAAPVRVGGYQTSGTASHVTVSGGYIYVGDNEGGLLILALDQDQDGIADPQDSCPDSDLRSTVFIQTCDTGVENKLLTGGCTMADEIAALTAQAGNHGDFVSGVAELSNEWKKTGLISGSQKDAVQSCAANASIP